MQSDVLKASRDKPVGLDSWRAEVLKLEPREILQICYGLDPVEDRLWLYLNELRRRSSQEAQLASCIVSYDLARRNNERARREFAYLAATMRELARDKVLVDNLLGDDPYLWELWGLVRSHLIHWDPRLPAESLEPAPVKVGFLPLLSDADFFDEGLQENFDKSQKDGNYRLQLALNTFLGCDPTIPYIDPNSGFKLATSADIERVETFLKEIGSLEKSSPQARGFKVLVLFFYGTHLRSQDIFGGINERKEVLLKDALESFNRYGEEFWSIVGSLEPLHERPGVWDKIVDLILDYCDWLAANSLSHNLDDYHAVKRLMERQSVEQGRRSSLRS
ncbi:MAG: hypothetical protein CMH60_01735 [Myxococcales bacterium]|nr:hypothetical protein [Myxococcales bacterium]